jgi:hypothetical protein
MFLVLAGLITISNGAGQKASDKLILIAVIQGPRGIVELR